MIINMKLCYTKINYQVRREISKPVIKVGGYIQDT